jgi:hypothetical protein
VTETRENRETRDTQQTTQLNLPEIARAIRDSGSDALASWTRSARAGVRSHRQEMLILAATAGFVVIVLLLSMPAVL